MQEPPKSQVGRSGNRASWMSSRNEDGRVLGKKVPLLGYVIAMPLLTICVDEVTPRPPFPPDSHQAKERGAKRHSTRPTTRHCVADDRTTANREDMVMCRGLLEDLYVFTDRARHARVASLYRSLLL